MWLGVCVTQSVMCDRFLRQLSSYPLGDDAVAAQLHVVVQGPLVLINWYLIDDCVTMCWIARVVHPSVVLVECLPLCSGQRLVMCNVTVDTSALISSLFSLFCRPRKSSST